MLRALVATIVVAAASTASAQTMMSPGSCTGMLTGTVGLSVQQSGTLQTIGSTTVPYVFGLAECQCSPMNPAQQIHLEIRLTKALPANTTGTAELWTGLGCDNYTTRTNATQTQCEKVQTLDINQFTNGGTATNGLIEIPFPGVALTSPQQHVCTTASASNDLFLFVIPTGASPTDTNATGTCTLNLSEQNQGPAAVSPSASGGEGAVTLSWQLPPVGTNQPVNFQVLCADMAGNPVPNQGTQTQLYSTCIGNMISRRILSTAGGGPMPTGDGGTSPSAFMPELDRTVPPHPYATDGGTSDMGVMDAGVDMAVSLGPFSTLDPRFLCGPQIGANGTNPSVRITGLTNYQQYQFVVLSIDRYGNATPSSPVVVGMPRPTDDLYRRYREDGGSASGFCFIATAAYGSYEHRYVRVLREFRDRVLLPTALGHAFVDWYYAHSPPAAAYIAAHGWARWLTRMALWPVIGGAAGWLYLAAWQKALLCTLLLALLLRKRLRAAFNRLRGQDA